MEQKKRLGFGLNGTMLIIYSFLAYVMYGGANNFGQNIQATANAQFFGWNANLVSTTYTIVIIAAVIIQFLFGQKIANVKNMKWLSIAFMLISAVGAVGMALVTFSEAFWLVCWMVTIFFSNMGCTLLIGVLVGQWFPRRKGTVMGISTIAFPVVNGVGISIFAAMYFTQGALAAWIPWIILDIVSVVICIIFVKDYPEQMGCFPDNDRSMTPEQAKAIMEMEREAKERSVWNIKNIARTPDYWLLAIPQGILLLGSVGAMTQIVSILNSYPEFYQKYGTIALLIFAVIACIGSYVLGLLDTKLGTKKSIMIACILMVISGILGFITSLPTLIIGVALLQVFMGASSNYCVSSAAQYWKREDFPSAFSYINPLANLIQAFGPMLVAIVGFAFGFNIVFIILAALGLVATIMIIAFKPERLKARDEKYKKEAGIE